MQLVTVARDRERETLAAGRALGLGLARPLDERAIARRIGLVLIADEIGAAQPQDLREAGRDLAGRRVRIGAARRLFDRGEVAPPRAGPSGRPGDSSRPPWR